MECDNCQNKRMYEIINNDTGKAYWCQKCGTLFDSLFNIDGGCQRPPNDFYILLCAVVKLFIQHIIKPIKKFHNVI